MNIIKSTQCLNVNTPYIDPIGVMSCESNFFGNGQKYRFHETSIASPVHSLETSGPGTFKQPAFNRWKW